MRFRTVRSVLIAFILLVAAGPVFAAAKEFDFKDPKGVNTIAFTLDSLLEPFSGVASGISGKVSFDPANPKATTGKITVTASTLHLVNKGMTETLHGADWLDVKKNPNIEFTIKKVTDAKPGKEEGVHDLTVVGDMNCKGKTKEMTVPVTVTHLPGKASERGGKNEGDLLVVRSTFSIKRADHDIKPDMPGKVVAEEIQLRVSIVGIGPKS